MPYIARIPNPTVEYQNRNGHYVTPSELVVPCVNMNGTSERELIEQLQDAYQACDTLMNALAAATPHGRDYQTVDNSLYQEARAQHDQRMRMVKYLQTELVDIALAVQDQKR